MGKHPSSNEWIGKLLRNQGEIEPTAHEDRTEEDQAIERIHPLSALQIATGDTKPHLESLQWLHGPDPKLTLGDPEKDIRKAIPTELGEEHRRGCHYPFRGRRE